MSFLGFSLLPHFSGIVDYRLVIRCFMSNIHLGMSTCHVSLSGLGYLIQDIFFSSSIHWYTNFKMSLFFFPLLTDYYSIMLMYHTFFIHSLVDVHLGCLQVLLQIMLLWTQLSKCPCGMVGHPLGMCPRVVFLGIEVDWFPIFWEIATLISDLTVQVCTPTSNGGVFLLLHILSSISCYQCFWS